MIEIPVLMADPVIRHGFFTRRGGCSDGVYASLNCGFGSQDDRDRIVRNRAHVATALNILPHQLVTGHQTHSIDVAIVDGPMSEAPRADALVSARTGVALGVLTADCAPVLMGDAVAGVIGATHAGWRGALAGILEATILTMERLGAARNRIAAAIGPAISQTAYEVGSEFQAAFSAEDPANARFFAASERPGHYQFDLPGYCTMRLRRLGLAAIETSGVCTYGQDQEFFSYRRATHRGEPDYGRQISAITLDPSGFDAGAAKR